MIEVSRVAMNTAVNRIPELQSLLYDLNLMPETVAEGSHNDAIMMNVIVHFVAFESRIKDE